MLAVVGLAATACSDDPADVAPPTTTPQSTVAPTTTEGPPPEFDIVGTALGATVFSQLAGFVVDAGLVETLRGPGPFTVFAPTDDAFAKIPADIKHVIQDDPELLVTVLTYHVVPGEIVAADLQEGELETVAGIPLTITRDGDDVYVNGNKVAAADVQATNGVVHVMGDVLVPPLGDVIDVATTLPGFSTLADLVTQADLVDTLKGAGPFTVFAPTNAAFDALPAGLLEKLLLPENVEALKAILTYHVVAGQVMSTDVTAGDVASVEGSTIAITTDGGVKVNGANVVAVDVAASNGVIHVIDAVIVPPTVDVNSL